MAKQNEENSKHDFSKKRNISQHGGTGGVWFLGFIGTLIYFLHFHSGSFGLVVTAFVKAIFWLAFLVYYALQFMKI